MFEEFFEFVLSEVGEISVNMGELSYDLLELMMDWVAFVVDGRVGPCADGEVSNGDLVSDGVVLAGVGSNSLLDGGQPGGEDVFNEVVEAGLLLLFVLLEGESAHGLSEVIEGIDDGVDSVVGGWVFGVEAVLFAEHSENGD